MGSSPPCQASLVNTEECNSVTVAHLSQHRNSVHSWSGLPRGPHFTALHTPSWHLCTLALACSVRPLLLRLPFIHVEVFWVLSLIWNLDEFIYVILTQQTVICTLHFAGCSRNFNVAWHSSPQRCLQSIW